jgi:hypothetical protein
MGKLVSKAQSDSLCMAEYTVINLTAVLQVANGRGASQTHDMDDFSFSSFNQLFVALDARQRVFPRSAMD